MSESVPSSERARVHVMDTTLRDGEQTPGVAFTPDEKLVIARALLLDVNVHRVEVASACVSPGELEAAQRIGEWARGAGQVDRVEVLGFCDGERSAEWAAKAGMRRVNLLTKGSERHCREQLRLAPGDHFAAVRASVQAASARDVRVTGAYLEDWSRGVADSPDYVRTLTRVLLDAGVERIFLADTVGCLAPADVARHVGAMRAAFPGAAFEFHGHDDYGLATANSLAAVHAGVRGVHTSVNGLGERAGNARLAQTVAALHDHAGVRTGVRELALAGVSHLVATASGRGVSPNDPVVGRDVFTQTAGVHADGDRKSALYVSQLMAERFGRTRAYALGKHSGRASLDQNLERLGLVATESQRLRLLARIVALGDQKRPVTDEDLCRLVYDLREGGGLGVQ